MSTGRGDWVNLVSPSTGPLEAAAVEQVLASGWLSSGPFVEKFEHQMAELAGVGHAVASSSCTTAQAILLAALDVGPGDEIITTPLTWPSICAAAQLRGAVIRFADVDPDTFNLSPAGVRSLLTHRTKLVVVVHFGGVVCELDAITAAAPGVPVIEDCAHAIGTTFGDGRHVGSVGVAGTFSFGGPKTLTCGEGGMITTRDADLARRCRTLRNSGETVTSIEKYRTRDFRSRIVEPSLNYRINELGAAVGTVQLEKLPALGKARTQVADSYRETLRRFAPRARPQLVPAGCVPVPFVFPLTVGAEPEPGLRDEVVAALRAERIEAGVHYPLIYWRDAFQRLAPADPGQCAVAERIATNIVTLPCHQDVPEHRVRDAARVIGGVLDG